MQARGVSPRLMPKTGSAAGINEPLAKRKVVPPKSAAGFLLMDCSLNVIAFNDEAAQILGYPDNVENLASSKLLLTEKIRSSLLTRSYPAQLVFIDEFHSGRRRYFCRAVPLDTQPKQNSHLSIAVLLERGPSGWISLSRVTEQFDLTRREQEVLEYLLGGMTTAEIASRMNVSRSTVKAFLRLIMIKMRVASRSAVIVKILMTEK